MKIPMISPKGFLLLPLLISIFLFTCCTREEANPGARPIVKTGKVIINTEEGGDITFKGELILDNSHPTITYGFYFGIPGNSKENYFLPAEASDDPLHFAASLGKTIKADTKYYVIAWAKTDRYEVYGDTLFFSAWDFPPPVINGIYPSSGKFGDTIMITGKYFDFYNQNNSVAFNYEPAQKSWSRQDTIWAIVPFVNSLPSLDIDVNVSVYGRYAIKPVHFSIKAPVVTSISATKGQYPDTIHVNGRDFDPGSMNIWIGDVRAQTFRQTDTSLSFVVPFLGTEQTVDIRLNSVGGFYHPVLSDFLIVGQQLLGVTAKSAWIGDTIILKAHNMDFRKFPIYGDVNGNTMRMIRQWKDSVSFILATDYQSTEFMMSFSLWNAVEESWLKVYNQTIAHRPPLLVSPGKTEYAYLEPIYIKARGIEIGGIHSSVIIKTADGSKTFNFMPQQPLSNTQELLPGHYTMQVTSGGNRLSNIMAFSIKEPAPQSIAPAIVSRGTEMQVTGQNLPALSDVVFTHQASGRKFYMRDWKTNPAGPEAQPLQIDELIGSGSYSAAIELPGKSYPFPNSVTVADHFQYVRKVSPALPYEYDARPSFAIGSKLFIPMSTTLFTVNMDNGNMSSKITSESVNGQPVFFSNSVYMSYFNYANDSQMDVFRFDPLYSVWNKLGGAALPISKLRPAMGVFDNQLVAICNNNIYKYDQGWIVLHVINNPKGFNLTGDQVLFKNGQLYLFDLTFGYVNVINTTTWTADRQIKLPHTYRGWERFVFEQDGTVYYYAIPENTSNTYYEAYRFNTSDETPELLEPRRLNYARYYTFCPDGNGNTYFIDNNYIYLFKP